MGKKYTDETEKYTFQLHKIFALERFTQNNKPLVIRTIQTLYENDSRNCVCHEKLN